MAAYTIEDIELIRRKSGISYQEAVALLDYHNGNVARALVDLERNGRINPDGSANRQHTTRNTNGNAGSAGKGGKTVNINKNTIMDLITKAYRARVKVAKGETPIINLSLLFSILGVLISPHLVIIGVIICLVLGYKISFDKHDEAFDSENLERTVRNAAENVKSSVSDFARGFQNGSSNAKADAQDDAASRSYYKSKPAAASATYHQPSAPTLNVPVQVESQDGEVTMEADKDGYTSATVE